MPGDYATCKREKRGHGGRGGLIDDVQGHATDAYDRATRNADYSLDRDPARPAGVVVFAPK